MKKILNKCKKFIKGFPAIKSHLDVFIALLTILLTVTVLAQNWKNLHGATSTTTSPTQQTPIPSQNSSNHPKRIYVQVTATPNLNQPTPSPQPTLPLSACTPGIGSIAISSPAQNSTVSQNPVCISINYNQGSYCSSVWAYNINGATYSSYGNAQPCFYSLPSGNITFNLMVKSLVNSDTQSISRSFIYSSTSASLQ